jgi:hypothetical protein
MKTKLLLIFLAITVTTFSQITLTHSDFQNAYAIGNEYTSYATPLFGPTLTVFVGEPSGSAQTWDFTGYDFSQAGNGVSVEPSTAPFYSLFPGCNVVMSEDSYFNYDTIHSWTYQELTSNELLLHGLSDENEAWPIYDPPAVQAVMPFTYGTAWQTDWDTTYLFPPYVYSVSRSEYLIDAFGTMTLPSGNYSCLRLTGFHESISYPDIDTLYTKNYHWYASDLTQVHITSIYEEQFNLSTIEINAFSYSKAGGPAGVDENEFSLNSIILEQNHPNPFNAATVINYSLTKANDVSLKVYDFLGKEIATLVNERQAEGQYQVDFSGEELNPGIYFYKLESGGESLMKKMMVMR